MRMARYMYGCRPLSPGIVVTALSIIDIENAAACSTGRRHISLEPLAFVRGVPRIKAAAISRVWLCSNDKPAVCRPSGDTWRVSARRDSILSTLLSLATTAFNSSHAEISNLLTPERQQK